MKRSALITEKLREGESAERLIKRFLKKCKKQRILDEVKEKTAFALTKSQKLREKRRKNKFLREKFARKRRNFR